MGTDQKPNTTNLNRMKLTPTNNFDCCSAAKSENTLIRAFIPLKGSKLIAFGYPFKGIPLKDLRRADLDNAVYRHTSWNYNHPSTLTYIGHTMTYRSYQAVNSASFKQAYRPPKSVNQPIGNRTLIATQIAKG